MKDRGPLCKLQRRRERAATGGANAPRLEAMLVLWRARSFSEVASRGEGKEDGIEFDVIEKEDSIEFDVIEKMLR